MAISCYRKHLHNGTNYKPITYTASIILLLNVNNSLFELDRTLHSFNARNLPNGILQGQRYTLAPHVWSKYPIPHSMGRLKAMPIIVLIGGYLYLYVVARTKY